MSFNLKKLYQKRLADACPKCSEGEGAFQTTKAGAHPYVTCAECDYETAPASDALRAWGYERLVRRWNLAVHEQTEELHWRMTGLENRNERLRRERGIDHKPGKRPTF